MDTLIAIVGPTAVGKSKLALEMANELNIEIINADSRQIYRYMDIGTSKSTKEEREKVPHHLIDIVNPDDSFSLALYKQLADKKISEIQQRNRIPVLVGGSGLYVWAIIEGWNVPCARPDYDFRHELEKEAQNLGNQVLYDRLKKIDAAAATKIHMNNVRRVIRALEIYNQTGIPPSHFSKRIKPPYNVVVVGLTVERNKLYKIIDNRVDDMMGKGLVQEVQNLLDIGYSCSLPSMASIGYNQICQYINGDISLAEAADEIKRATRRLARRQYTWFPIDDNRIIWMDIDKVSPWMEVTKLVKKTVKSDLQNYRQQEMTSS